MEKEYDAVGIGNALIDILVQIDADRIQKFNLQKGSFNELDEQKVNSILSSIGNLNPKMVPAGSASNTIMGMANLGGKYAFIGRVGDDAHGDFFSSNLKQLMVHPQLTKCNISGTGKCISLITPDSERTFAANLGAARNLSAADVSEDHVKKSKILHSTAYEIESAREAVFHSMDVARSNGTKISFDLADPFLIKRQFSEITKVLNNGVDFIFANEAEALAFTGLADPFEAVNELFKYAEIAVVKIGAKGSLIKQNQILIQAPIYPTKVIDTTGAGDLYAAGFLWGCTRNKSLETCGKIGAFMASKVISQIGAIIGETMTAEVEKI